MLSILFYRSLRLVGAVLGLAAVSEGLVACSQYSNRPLSKAYHNANAHYNAYWIARDRIHEAESILFKTRQENYNQLLPILLPVDSVASQPVKQQLDDAIKKASLVAERHQNSKWLDNSYVLIGKARLYKQDLPNAIEVFKYVNTKGKDEADKHEALTGLMRAYIEAGDYTNGLTVADYLRTQPLNKINTRDFYLTKAYLHERRGEYGIAVGILEATFPLLKKGEETARLHLIAGQLYDLLNQPAKATDQYNRVLAARPTYDQSFYANIFRMQSNGLDPRQATRANASFQDLLKDRKNVDLRDKIYFTMGLLEARRGQYDKAIGYYRQSVQATTTNTAQVPYTYLELGKLFFEKKQDYRSARAYYDSALAILPVQSVDYAALNNRKKLLDEFVNALTTIQLEDSLQRLARLDPAALDKVLDNAITQKERREQAQANVAQQVAANTGGQATNSNLQPNERWYLYNPVLLAQGQQDFSQRWGNRSLEDNWRRNNKDASQAVASENSPLNGGSPANSVNTAAPITPSADLIGQPGPGTPTGNVAQLEASAVHKSQKDALYAQIPFSKEALARSNERLELALYQVGKLEKFQLDQPKEAITTFEQLLTRFPATNYKPEAYYLLHLASQQTSQSADWKDKLLREFPNTSYARLLSRTTGSGQLSSDTEGQAQKTYTDIYELYKSGKTTEALARLGPALNTYAGSQLEDKMALLRAMLIGSVQGPDAYRQALTEFIRDYPASPLLPRVKEFQAAANQPTAKRK